MPLELKIAASQLVEEFTSNPLWIVPGLAIAGIIALIVYTLVESRRDYKRDRLAAEAKAKYLWAKYPNEETFWRIAKKEVWVGETEEQLQDSLGHPEDVDQKVLKTKKREVWKYYRVGANRFRFRITLENGIVVGWEHK